MIFRKEKEHGVLTEEEILDMARDIAENDPAYIIGSMLIKSVCDDTGLDEGAAFSMLLDGGGMPKGIAAISARAAHDLMRLYEEGGIEGEIDSYLEDERFVKMLLEMPVKAALRLYAAECNADAAARAEREKGAMDVMEKLAARRALPSPIKGNTPAAADTDYANMPTREFNIIKERLMRALYYVTLPDIKDAELYSETVKANENNLNQNFTAIAQKIEELETRLSALE